MPDDYGVLIVGTLAPFCAVASSLAAANDDSETQSSTATGELVDKHPVPQSA